MSAYVNHYKMKDGSIQRLTKNEAWSQGVTEIATIQEVLAYSRKQHNDRKKLAERFGQKVKRR